MSGDSERITGYAEVILILGLPLLPACRRYGLNLAQFSHGGFWTGSHLPDIGFIGWNDSRRSHAANQAQKEPQIAESVADDAWPCVSCALCNKGKRHTCDCHA